MSKSTDLYPYDSDDENETLSFSRIKMQVQVSKIEGDIPLVSSYILTKTAQSLLSNPEAISLYREKKAELNKQLKLDKPEFHD